MFARSKHIYNSCVLFIIWVSCQRIVSFEVIWPLPVKIGKGGNISGRLLYCLLSISIVHTIITIQTEKVSMKRLLTLGIFAISMFGMVLAAGFSLPGWH